MPWHASIKTYILQLNFFQNKDLKTDYLDFLANHLKTIIGIVIPPKVYVAELFFFILNKTRRVKSRNLQLIWDFSPPKADPPSEDTTPPPRWKRGGRLRSKWHVSVVQHPRKWESSNIQGLNNVWIPPVYAGGMTTVANDVFDYF